jgi:hypothetical protein
MIEIEVQSQGEMAIIRNRENKALITEKEKKMLEKIEALEERLLNLEDK